MGRGLTASLTLAAAASSGVSAFFPALSETGGIEAKPAWGCPYYLGGYR